MDKFAPEQFFKIGRISSFFVDTLAEFGLILVSTTRTTPTSQPTGQLHRVAGSPDPNELELDAEPAELGGRSKGQGKAERELITE